MTIVHDIWGNDVEITQTHVSYRNRLIDVHLIHTFQVKGKRLLINSFKQNQSIPTMCIFFETKEKAEEVYGVMKDVYYAPVQKEQKVSGCEAMTYLGMSLAIPVGLLAAILSRSCV
jgi:hypothetical protein